MEARSNGSTRRKFPDADAAGRSAFAALSVAASTGAARLVRACVILIAVLWVLPAQSQERLELHLVLAFDVSASVNDAEFELQRKGSADALRDPAVGAAVEAAKGGVAITIIQWSSVTRQALGLDWVVLRTRTDTLAYAQSVQDMPRRLPGGGTMIHSGLEFAARRFRAAPGDARRRVIDLSGNGRTDDVELLHRVRDRLVAEGVVINGLAIEELHNDLTGYFRRNLIGGAGAFVVTADEFEDFSAAMRIKLLREIKGTVVARAD